MAFVTPVVEHWLEREIAQWVHPPIKDRSDDPSHHERTLLPRSYISLLAIKSNTVCFTGVYMSARGISSVMRAVRVSRFGGPEVLQVESNVPIPQIKETEVTILLAFNY